MNSLIKFNRSYIIEFNLNFQKKNILLINSTFLSSWLLLHFIELLALFVTVTVQKMKLSIKDFFSKCDQIRRKLRIWSHLLKKSLMENFISWKLLLCSLYSFSRKQLKTFMFFAIVSVKLI